MWVKEAFSLHAEFGKIHFFKSLVILFFDLYKIINYTFSTVTFSAWHDLLHCFIWYQWEYKKIHILFFTVLLLQAIILCFYLPTRYINFSSDMFQILHCLYISRTECKRLQMNTQFYVQNMFQQRQMYHEGKLKHYEYLY